MGCIAQGMQPINNNIITLYNYLPKCYQTWGDRFLRYIYVKALCCIPETSIILYLNSNKKQKTDNNKIFAILNLIRTNRKKLEIYKFQKEPLEIGTMLSWVYIKSNRKGNSGLLRSCMSQTLGNIRKPVRVYVLRF